MRCIWHILCEPEMAMVAFYDGKNFTGDRMVFYLQYVVQVAALAYRTIGIMQKMAQGRTYGYER